MHRYYSPTCGKQHPDLRIIRDKLAAGRMMITDVDVECQNWAVWFMPDNKDLPIVLDKLVAAGERLAERRELPHPSVSAKDVASKVEDLLHESSTVHALMWGVDETPQVIVLGPPPEEEVDASVSLLRALEIEARPLCTVQEGRDLDGGLLVDEENRVWVHEVGGMGGFSLIGFSSLGTWLVDW